MSSRICRSSSSSKRPSSDGINALASSGASGHKLPKLQQRKAFDNDLGRTDKETKLILPCEFELVQFLLSQEAPDARDCLFVLELAEIFGVAVSLLEHLGELLLLF